MREKYYFTADYDNHAAEFKSYPFIIIGAAAFAKVYSRKIHDRLYNSAFIVKSLF